MHVPYYNFHSYSTFQYNIINIMQRYIKKQSSLTTFIYLYKEHLPYL